MAILKELRIGNAETERMIKTIKEEVIWTHVSMCFKEWMGKEGSKKVA